MSNQFAVVVLLAVASLSAAGCGDASAGGRATGTPDQRLLLGIETGDVDVVREALEAGADANGRDEDKPVLTLAAASGNVAIVDLLLDRGAGIDTPTGLGVTPLFAAALYRRSDCARRLVERGADIDAVNDAGATALMFAVTNGDEELAGYLVDQGADVRLASVQNGSTALMLAASGDMTELMQRMLERGADVAASDRFGNTALSYAKSEAARELLVAAGAVATEEQPDPNAEADVREAFASFQQVLGGTGGDVGGVVSRATLDKYGEWRDRALRDDKPTLRRLPLFEQFLVLRLRLAFTGDELGAMSAEQLVAAGIARGWVDGDGVRAMQLGEVRVIGKAASARVERDGRDIGMPFVFAKDPDGWRVDLLQLMLAGQAAIRQMLAQFDGGEEQQLQALLGQASGEPVGAEVWEALAR